MLLNFAPSLYGLVFTDLFPAQDWSHAAFVCSGSGQEKCQRAESFWKRFWQVLASRCNVIMLCVAVIKVWVFAVGHWYFFMCCVHIFRFEVFDARQVKELREKNSGQFSSNFVSVHIPVWLLFFSCMFACLFLRLCLFCLLKTWHLWDGIILWPHLTKCDETELLRQIFCNLTEPW